MGKTSTRVATPKAAATANKNWFSAMEPWKKATIAIVALLVAIVVGVVLVVNFATSAPVRASNAFVNNIQARDSNTAYAQMSAAAQATITRSDFKTLIDQIGPILNTEEKMKNKEVVGRAGSPATAKVEYEITGTDSVTYIFTVNLIKDNGNWKVQNFVSDRK
jgi:hypothetical protein